MRAAFGPRSPLAQCSLSVCSNVPCSVSPRQIRTRWVGAENPSISELSTSLPDAPATFR